MKIHWTHPILCLAAICLAACGGGPSGPAKDTPDDAPAWLEGLPSAPPPQAGTSVWATVQGADGAVLVGAFDVVPGEAEGEVALVDSVGNRFTEAPAALMRARLEAEPAAGDLVLAQVAGSGMVVGRASGQPGVVQIDWNGTAVESSVIAVEKLDPASEQPYRPVAYQDTVGWQRGWLLAADESRSWVQAMDRRVVTLDNTHVHSIRLGAPLTAGTEVMAWSWAEGFRPGRVIEAGASGMYFQVQLAGEQGPERFGIADLLAQPAPWAAQ